MLRLRSCASSRMIVSYWRSSRSCAISASRTPSVMSLTRVPSPTWSVNRIFQPTTSPSGLPTSSAIRSATLRAAMRRGWVCPIRPRMPRPELERDLRQLGGLARPGLARDDDDLGVAQGGGDVVPALADRQFVGIADHRDGGPAAGDPRLGGRDVGGDALALPFPRLRVAGLPQPVEPPAQPVLVEDRELRQPGPEVVARGTHGRARVPLGRQGSGRTRLQDRTPARAAVVQPDRHSV